MGGALALGLSAPLMVVAFLLLLGAVQNARRPAFVAYLDRYMAKRWRATTLSVENLARAWLSAMVLLAGWLAHMTGLVAVAVVAGGLFLSAALAVRRHSVENRSQKLTGRTPL
ncbi:MAG: hypothetical protein AB7K09_15190 [Planctomycetota bacterium]